MTASEILTRAASHIGARAASRDLPRGERSMARCVNAFNALTGAGLTETQGWLFMVMLKAARATAGTHNADDYEDGAAYFALAGESANVPKNDQPGPNLGPVQVAANTPSHASQDCGVANLDPEPGSADAAVLELIAPGTPRNELGD